MSQDQPEATAAISLELLRTKLMPLVPLGDVRTILDTTQPIAAACMVILLDEISSLRERVAALEAARG